MGSLPFVHLHLVVEPDDEADDGGEDDGDAAAAAAAAHPAEHGAMVVLGILGGRPGQVQDEVARVAPGHAGPRLQGDPPLLVAAVIADQVGLARGGGGGTWTDGRGYQ